MRDLPSLHSQIDEEKQKGHSDYAVARILTMYYNHEVTGEEVTEYLTSISYKYPTVIKKIK
jgi:hypothetical protein